VPPRLAVRKLRNEVPRRPSIASLRIEVAAALSQQCCGQCRRRYGCFAARVCTCTFCRQFEGCRSLIFDRAILHGHLARIGTGCPGFPDSGRDHEGFDARAGATPFNATASCRGWMPGPSGPRRCTPRAVDSPSGGSRRRPVSSLDKFRQAVLSPPVIPVPPVAPFEFRSEGLYVESVFDVPCIRTAAATARRETRGVIFGRLSAPENKLDVLIF